VIKIHFCPKLNSSEDPYIKWCVELLAPVILGAKPAEIMSFPEYTPLNNEKKEKIKDFFTCCKKMNYIEFKTSNGCPKVIFYNPISLNETLSDVRILKFLKGYGYPEEYSLDIYLNHLARKMEIEGMPHEIGVFLGYPLKDVLGFLGHPSLKLTKVNGWHVYGDPTLSDMKYNSFMEAKNIIREKLKLGNIREVVLTA